MSVRAADVRAGMRIVVPSTTRDITGVVRRHAQRLGLVRDVHTQTRVRALDGREVTEVVIDTEEGPVVTTPNHRLQMTDQTARRMRLREGWDWCDLLSRGDQPVSDPAFRRRYLVDLYPQVKPSIMRHLREGWALRLAGGDRP